MASRTLEHDYKALLDQIVDDVYEEAKAKGWSWYKLSRMADLSTSTVHNLGMRTTHSPHLRTVYKLVRAVGMNLHVITVLKKKRKAA